MPFQPSEESALLLTDSVYATPATHVGKRGALSVPPGGKGWDTIPAPVMIIKFTDQGRAQEQGAMMPIIHSSGTSLTIPAQWQRFKNSFPYSHSLAPGRKDHSGQVVLVVLCSDHRFSEDV